MTTNSNDLVELGNVGGVTKVKAGQESFLEKIRRLLWIGKRQTPEEYFAQWI